MTKYVHMRVKGFKPGYYEEAKAWDIVHSVPQSDVKFLAGSFSIKEVRELREQARQSNRRPQPIID